MLVLEYLRGGQLYDSLHRLGGSEEPYTEQGAAAIFAQVGWVHKPSLFNEISAPCVPQARLSAPPLLQTITSSRPCHMPQFFVHERSPILDASNGVGRGVERVQHQRHKCQSLTESAARSASHLL